MRNNKNILITGSKNLGFAIGEHLAENGYNIHITSRDSKEAQNAAQTIKKRNPDIDAYAYELELRNVDNIRSVFMQIRDNVGSLDGFVANAAHLGIDLDIFNTGEEDFDSVINTNIKGTFFCCQEAGKLMVKKGGSIVIIGSVQSKGVVEGRTVYGISKAALGTLSKYLAYDFAPYNIRVNCLVAGAIHTSRWDNSESEIIASRRANYPLGREADMEDVANGVLYLLSDMSKSTTGTDLVIDSGVLLPLLPYKDRKRTIHEEYK